MTYISSAGSDAGSAKTRFSNKGVVVIRPRRSLPTWTVFEQP